MQGALRTHLLAGCLSPSLLLLLLPLLLLLVVLVAVSVLLMQTMQKQTAMMRVVKKRELERHSQLPLLLMLKMQTRS